MRIPSRPFYRPPQKTRAELFETLKVGDEVAMFDSNHRIYPDPKPGETYASGGPLYRGHFHKETIRGETSRSWVIGWGRGSKIPKKTLPGFYSCACIDTAVFVHDHGYKIVEALRRFDSRGRRPEGVDNEAAEVLRAVAALIGYEITETTG